MVVASENKPFFTKSCHRQTNHNYEQPPKTILTFKVIFLCQKLVKLSKKNQIL